MIIDGLDVLREQLPLVDIMRLIEKTAKWVCRETFFYLPIWFPEEARRDLMYKSNWCEPQLNRSKTTGEEVHKRVGNTNANSALTWALGMRVADRPNWTCCHIWSVDDPAFQRPNVIAGDKRFYSCVANMVLLPTPLKAFSDAMPEVKTMLRVAAGSFYGWSPEHNEIASLEQDREQCIWEAFPKSWPKETGEKEPPGVVAISASIKSKANQRLNRVISDLDSAGNFYPRREVREVLNYWSECVPQFGDRLKKLNFKEIGE